MLANDPHTGFRMPPLFYLAHLRAPGLELGGATWPGVPVFWTGTNLDIAWGQVAVHASTSDLYMEMLHPADSHRYDRNGVWLDATRRSERIDVRYEEMAREPQSIFGQLQEFLGVQEQTLTYSQQPLNVAPMRELLANYDELREAFRDTQYAWMFTDVAT